MPEILTVDDQFEDIVAHYDETAAEVFATAEGTATLTAGESSAPTTFETLARTPDAIRDNMTRLIVMNSTTDYTMPEGEKD